MHIKAYEQCLKDGGNLVHLKPRAEVVSEVVPSEGSSSSEGVVGDEPAVAVPSSAISVSTAAHEDGAAASASPDVDIAALATMLPSMAEATVAPLAASAAVVAEATELVAPSAAAAAAAAEASSSESE
eukprot:3883511-Alexandrium_andersonii.AAC.1